MYIVPYRVAGIQFLSMLFLGLIVGLTPMLWYNFGFCVCTWLIFVVINLIWPIKPYLDEVDAWYKQQGQLEEYEEEEPSQAALEAERVNALLTTTDDVVYSTHAVDEDQAIDIIYDFCISCIENEQYLDIYEFMFELDFDLPVAVLLAPLAITVPVKDKIWGRQEYFDAVAGELVHRQDPNILGLLKGLE